MEQPNVRKRRRRRRSLSSSSSSSTCAASDADAAARQSGEESTTGAVPDAAPLRRISSLRFGLFDVAPRAASENRPGSGTTTTTTMTSADDEDEDEILRLVRPVYHPSLPILRATLSILRCVCLRCSRIPVRDLDEHLRLAEDGNLPRSEEERRRREAESSSSQVRSDLLRIVPDDVLERVASFAVRVGDDGSWTDGPDVPSLQLTCRRLWKLSFGRHRHDLDLEKLLRGALTAAATAASFSRGDDGSGGARANTGPLTRLADLAAALQNKSTCDRCGARRPRLRAVGTRLDYEFDDGMNREDFVSGGNGDGDGCAVARDERLAGNAGPLPARLAMDVLASVNDNDCSALGLDPSLSRPERLLVSSLALPSLSAAAASSRSDPTPHRRKEEPHERELLSDVRFADAALRRSIEGGAPRDVQRELEASLQRAVVDWMRMRGHRRADAERTLAGLADRAGGGSVGPRRRPSTAGGAAPIAPEAERGAASASAAAVRVTAVADPNVGIDEVGVPSSVASRLPGLRDGDVVVVSGRGGVGFPFEAAAGPTISGAAGAAHYARVFPRGGGGAIRLHPSCLSAHNVRGEGAEMGLDLRVPRSVPSRVEAEQLMLASENLASSFGDDSKLLAEAGLVQDSLLVAFQMSQRDAFLDRDELFDLLSSGIGDGGWWDGHIPAPAIVRPRELWTGKQVLSLVLPRIDLAGRTMVAGRRHSSDGRWPDPKLVFNGFDDRVTIRGGELLEGVLDGRTAGGSRYGIVRGAWLDARTGEAARFLDGMQSIAASWFLRRSFGAGVADCLLDDDASGKIDGILRKAEVQVKDIIRCVHRGQIETTPGLTLLATLDSYACSTLLSGTQMAQKCVETSLDARVNGLRAMSAAGSGVGIKGISKITACVGQQLVWEDFIYPRHRRIRCGFRQRTLPHFTKTEHGARGRGFISSSYVRGLLPDEFFFHCIAAWDDLANATRYAHDVGSIRRRLVRGLEAMTVQYDGTLRKRGRKVIQFLYGEDGIDGTYARRQKFDSLCLADAEFERMYVLDARDPYFGRDDSGRLFLADRILEECDRDAESLQELLDEEAMALREDQRVLRAAMANRRMQAGDDESSYLPGDVRGVINKAISTFRIDRSKPTDLHPRAAISKVNELLERLNAATACHSFSGIEDGGNATSLFRILVRSLLASKRVLSEWRLTAAALDWVVDQIEVRFRRAMVCPGEAAGVLAARSIQAPPMYLPPYNLRGGYLTMEVITGMPRFVEIIDSIKTIQTPEMTLYLKEGIGENCGVARSLCSAMKYTKLGDLVKLTEIHYDPNLMRSAVAKDEEFVKEYYEFSDETDRLNLRHLSPWVLRLELEPGNFFYRGFSMNEVAGKIESEHRNAVHVIVTDDNADDLVVRVRLVNSDMPETSRRSLDGIFSSSDEGATGILFGSSSEEVEEEEGGGLIGGTESLFGSSSEEAEEEEEEDEGGGDIGAVTSSKEEQGEERGGNRGALENMIRSSSGKEDEKSEKLTEEQDFGFGHDLDVVLLLKLEKNLLDLKIRGIQGVEKAFLAPRHRLVWNGDTGFRYNQEWVLFTKGSNLMAIRDVDCIDGTRTTSNDVHEVLAVLGIEAARNVMLKELIGTVFWVGTWPEYRHLACLVDAMTVHGDVVAVDCQQDAACTISRPLVQTSHEDTFDKVINAAVCGNDLMLDGLTENIMMGQLPTVGTGSMDVT